jgi:hypothetical protein
MACGCGDDGRPTTRRDGGADGSLDGATTARDATVADGGSRRDGEARVADAAADGGRRCERAPAPADRERFVVVSHYFDADGVEDDRYQVLSLSEDGELSHTGETFRMRTATRGRIVFTPDGQVGYVAQEDGSLGIFQLSEDGSVQVLREQLEGDFYARRLVMTPTGDRLWVIDAQVRDNGGGIWSFDIGCDGRLVRPEQRLEGELPYQLVLLDGGRALVAARNVLGTEASPASTPGDDVHLLTGWPSSPAVAGGADAFGDDDAIVPSAEVTADGRFALFGDNASFAGVGARVAVVSVGEADLAPVQVLSGIPDPTSIVASPFDDAALVVSGLDGDALYVLDYEPEADPPFSNRGELAYEGAGPRLPDTAVLIDRGRLRGRVLVSQVSEIRQVQFEGEGRVTDLGIFNLGGDDDIDQIIGAMGVQP